MFKKIAVAASVLAATSSLTWATELTIAGRDSSYGQALEYVVNAYKQDHPDTDITLVKRPGKGLYESVVLSMREQTGNYDVIMMDDTWAPEFFSQSWLSPLSSSMSNQDFIDTTLDIGRYPDPNGQVYAVPMVGNVAMFAWNKATFTQSGITQPNNWSEVLEAAKIINAKEGHHGVVFRGVKGNPIVTGFLPILWGYGADVVDANGQSTLNTPEALQALKTFIELKKYAPKGVDVYNADEVRNALQTNQVAMAIEVWPAWIPDLDNSSVSDVVGDIQIMSPPAETGQPSPMLGIWQLAIPKDAKNKPEAESFIQFATSAPIQKALALEFGIPPTRQSVYLDEQVVNQYRWYPQQAQALASAKPRPRIQNWAQVESILGDFLQLAMLGQMSPEQALQQAERRINRLK